ncbi:MAG: hypothetical protein EAX95_01920 [Candidatus Thorarchaeota archaeon]|nr:hypothetical protein [Candidatus Thorarchaeota archaeon]
MTDFHDYLESLMRTGIREAESALMEDREEFTFPTAKPQWAPPRNYDIEHLLMDWKMHLQYERVDAVAKIAIKSIVPDLSDVLLHSVELNIKEVLDSKKKKLNWENRSEDEAIIIHLLEPLKRGETTELEIAYAIDKPRAGLYFTKPTPEFPEVEISAWTQLQDDYARYVVPIYDNPSHKFSVETIVTVPKGHYAMGCGFLKARTENDDGTETFHWLNEEPMPAYIITVAVSEYIEYKEDLDGLDVSYYAHKKWDRETVYRSFGKTPAMIKFFAEKLGVEYPWAKYAQVTAANFIFGGMENVSATTQTDATLHDEKAHRDFDSDGLVSHELAHMWGGDLVTCRTWSHGWLNEGWATQMQNEWKRHDKGFDEYLYEQYEKQQSYFDEDKTNYRRPIVKNEWERGGDVFDRHLYPGGAWRYYMLKHLVGEDRWWEILGEWLRRFSFKSAYTHDLEALFTEMTGEDYGWFFEQWLYKAGYPECKIEVSHDNKLGHVLVKIEQTQTHDDGMTPEVFRFPLTVELVDDQDIRTRYTVNVTERIHSFYYPVSKKPKQVIIDPDYAVLIDSKIEKPESMWIEQLQHGENVIQRLKSAHALSKKITPKGLETLGTALLSENFWGVQAEIAKALGSLKTDSALDYLLKGVTLTNTKARTAVARALGQFYKNNRAFEALKSLLEDKESYFVASAAAVSIGKTQHDNAFEVLSKGIKTAQPSWQRIVQQGYLNGLMETECEEVIDIAKQFMNPGAPDELRRIVPSVLARLGKRYKKERPEVKSDIEKLLLDKSFRVRIMALIAVKSYEDASLISVLSKVAESEAEGRPVRYAREAIRALGMKKEPKELASLKKSVEELQQESRELKDKLAKIEFLLKNQENES